MPIYCCATAAYILWHVTAPWARDPLSTTRPSPVTTTHLSPSPPTPSTTHISPLSTPCYHVPYFLLLFPLVIRTRTVRRGADILDPLKKISSCLRVSLCRNIPNVCHWRIAQGQGLSCSWIISPTRRLDFQFVPSLTSRETPLQVPLCGLLSRKR